MELQKQVVSLELAKKLEELGVPQNSIFYYQGMQHEIDENRPVLVYGKQYKHESVVSVSAFTVAELGEMLPSRLEIKNTDEELVAHHTYRCAMEKQETRWNVVYICAHCHGRLFEPMLAVTEADARAKCLQYLLENNLLSVEKINAQFTV